MFLKKIIKIKQLLSLIALSFLPIVSIALPSDSQEPWSLTSEEARIDHKAGVSVYTGNVVFDQGTTHIWADELTVHLENNKIKKAIAIGKPAKYQTLPEEGKPVVNATAKIMEYYEEKALVVLIGDAMVTQGDNVLRGPRIEYNTVTQVVVTPATGNGRTTIVVVPKKAKEK